MSTTAEPLEFRSRFFYILHKGSTLLGSEKMQRKNALKIEFLLKEKLDIYRPVA